jgi:predicted dehydrogenase
MQEVEGIRLIASCRDNTEAAAEFAAEHGGRSYGDWQDVLADPQVDAVLIGTPHDLYEAIAIGAAKAGKHILLEKPLAQPSRPTTRSMPLSIWPACS